MHNLAINTYSEALLTAHCSRDKLLVIQASEGLGAVYFNTGQYNNAIENYKQALEVLDTVSSDTGLARERVMEKLSCVIEKRGEDSVDGTSLDHSLVVCNDGLSAPVINSGSLALGQDTRTLYTTVTSHETSNNTRTRIISVTDVHNHPTNDNTIKQSSICTLL